MGLIMRAYSREEGCSKMVTEAVLRTVSIATMQKVVRLLGGFLQKFVHLE